MIAPLARFIDWSSLQVAYLFLSRNTDDPRLGEAIQFLNSSDFIPAESQPAKVEFDNLLDFRFSTPRPCDFAENNFAVGRFYRSTEQWPKHPTIILLHGGNVMGGGKASLSHRRFRSIARLCNRSGLNAATLIAPYHCQRLPRQTDALSGLDYVRVVEMMAQGVAEIRALTGWLLEQGCPAVALWGVSLGGWRVGLTICRDSRLTAAVLTMPGVCMNHLTLQTKRVIWRRLQSALQARRVAYAAFDETPVNLISSTPSIRRENILLIEGVNDLIADKEPIEQLWQAWGQPEIWRLPFGHRSIFCLPSLTDRIIGWLAPRLQRD